MYRGRSFDLITISTDKQVRKTDALNLLKKQEASNKNYIFNDYDVHKLIETIDNDWQLNTSKKLGRRMGPALRNREFYNFS